MVPWAALRSFRRTALIDSAEQLIYETEGRDERQTKKKIVVLCEPDMRLKPSRLFGDAGVNQERADTERIAYLHKALDRVMVQPHRPFVAPAAPLKAGCAHASLINPLCVCYTGPTLACKSLDRLHLQFELFRKPEII